MKEEALDVDSSFPSEKSGNEITDLSNFRKRTNIAPFFVIHLIYLQ